MKLYVSNFITGMTEDGLRYLFKPFGMVDNVRIITDHYTRQSKGFAYIDMPNHVEGRMAIEGLNGFSIDNLDLVVKEARSRDERRGKGW